MFYLEEKYYGNSVFNEIDSNDLNNLINDKESFAIFIHQPFCSTSYEFNKILDEANFINLNDTYKLIYKDNNEPILISGIS